MRTTFIDRSLLVSNGIRMNRNDCLFTNCMCGVLRWRCHLYPDQSGMIESKHGRWMCGESQEDYRE